MVIKCSLESTVIESEAEVTIPEPVILNKIAIKECPEQEPCERSTELTTASVRNALGIKPRTSSYGGTSPFGRGPKPRNCLINFDHALSKNKNVYEEFKALKAKKPQN